MELFRFFQFLLRLGELVVERGKEARPQGIWTNTGVGVHVPEKHHSRMRDLH